MEIKPFFTILTASLNNGATIRRTLESLSKQTFQDFEHIVADGNSVDDTISLLEECETTYNLSWISEPDGGIAEALNKGLRRSKGTYVLVIQADDRLHRWDVLEKAYAITQKEGFDIYSFPVILDHSQKGAIVRRPIPMIWWNRFKFIFPHQGCFVHRRVFEKIGGFREDFEIAMDYDFFYRAILAGCTVKFHRTPPVAVMGGLGVGSNPDLLRLRLKEEFLVQRINEKNLLWRILQLIFRGLYHPYKTSLIPQLRENLWP
jgi:glycosyltransferase involved in cell wall biosynthesis